MMHANVLQYQHYLEKQGRQRELNRILLLTPNEGLSQQHLREFDAAGIDAELFNKDGRGLFTGRAVEILEVTRLREDMGDKTIAIDAFEGNNLVPARRSELVPREWELPHLEYRDLEGDDPNFLCAKESTDNGYYRILIDKSQEEIVAKLEELKAAIEKGDLKPWEFQGMKAIWFGKHLYQSLLYLDKTIVQISPAPLNKGERQFVEDLKAFHEGNADYFKTRELYLLRNLSKGRGVGFFEAGNFHPDFILWLLMGDRQHVIFVDPKGIRTSAWTI